VFQLDTSKQEVPSHVADIAGGSRAGLRTVWIHRSRRSPPEILPLLPDHHVATVSDAIDILLNQRTSVPISNS
jgi:FMN phosphatase YigB (HAD superfamily)